MPILEQTTAWGTRNVLIPDGVPLEVGEEEDCGFGPQTKITVEGVVTICFPGGNIMVHGGTPFLVDGSKGDVSQQLHGRNPYSIPLGKIVG